MAPPVQGVQKTGLRPEKQFLDCRLAAPEKKKEKKPAGLKTRPTWWRQDRLGACPVVCCGARTARRGVRFRARLEAADGDDLVLRPDPNGKGVGSTLQDGIRAVERWDDAAVAQPDKGGAQELVWPLELELCLGREKAGASKVFKHFLTIESTENSSPCKNLLGRTRTIEVPKTASAGGRPVSSLSCAWRLRSIKGNSSIQVSVAARARNASLRRPTIHGQTWSNETPCQSICRKNKTKKHLV
jgi:hypothetical protein